MLRALLDDLIWLLILVPFLLNLVYSYTLGMATSLKMGPRSHLTFPTLYELDQVQRVILSLQCCRH
jgi:hypothetical protein